MKLFGHLNNPSEQSLMCNSATEMTHAQGLVLTGSQCEAELIDYKIESISWLFLALCEIVLAAIFWILPGLSSDYNSNDILSLQPKFFILAGISVSLSIIACIASAVMSRNPDKAKRVVKLKVFLLAAVYFPTGWALGILLSTDSTILVGAVIMVTISLGTGLILTFNDRTKSMAIGLLAVTLGIGIGYANFGYWVAFAAYAIIFSTWIPPFQRRLKAKNALLEKQMRSMNRANAILADFENTGNGWFWETDRQNRLTYISERAAKTMKRNMATLIGEPVTILIDANQQRDENQERTLNFHLTVRAPFKELTVRVATNDEDRWWSITGRPIFDKYNNFQGFRGSGTDLTEMRKSQAEVSRLAHFDSLTGLSNRLHMQTSMERILASPNPANRICTLMLLDLDRFKEVNDTMGHPAGDALLRQVSQRLQRIIGASGHVGRLGGDEFQLILTGKDSKAQLGPLAEQIIQTISQPYLIDSSTVTIGVSIGIAIAPQDGVTNEALVRNADLALYAAKGRGRGVHHFYDPDLHSDAEERRQLEADLRNALSENALELMYQPVIATKTETIVGVEALLRWNHPTRGYISPARFIPIAEDTGLITQIGEWTLRTACAEAATWPARIKVAVNVSPIQFANPSLPAIITNTLANSGLLPAQLELEITESVFLNDDANTEAMFRALKSIGVRLALDDFGTGYSSLGYLKKAPFDKIKIDQSFVRGATQSGSRNGAIISSIVSLAEALGMDTTAEGVETHDELELIRILGCSHIQGYIYSKPLTPEALIKILGNTETVVEAKGHSKSREHRKKMLRGVTLIHDGTRYEARIKDLSSQGVLIEGLSNVPENTPFLIDIGDGILTRAECRWSKGNRMGLALLNQVSSVDQMAAERLAKNSSMGHLKTAIG